jgi:23S rRNA pseudouridine1911/1915/1917 synthase
MDSDSSIPNEGDDSPQTETVVHEFRNEGAPRRLDHFLCDHLSGRTRAFVQRLIEEGNVTLRPPREVKPAVRVQRNMVVRVVIPPPRKLDLTPQDIPFKLLYEDSNIAVIDKPAGLTVHPSSNQVGHTLVNALLFRLSNLSGIGGVERPGIVHRLDKETSGVLLVAKNDFAHTALACQFKERLVHKTYIAISRGEPRDWEGRIDLNIGRSYTHTKKQMIRADGSGRNAITDYRVLEVFRGYCLLELYPLTGRTHQIRVHLASQRLPVACDKLYGRERHIFVSELQQGKRPRSDELPILDRHALHAAGICFRHPLTREEMVFSAPLAPDMHKLRKTLEQHRAVR